MVTTESGESRLFRYYPGDFGALTVKVLHMDLVFEIHEQHTRTTSRLLAEVLESPVRTLVLNACDLEIGSVTCDVRGVNADYDRTRNLLTLTFDRDLDPRTRFTIRTESICRPNDHLLEGLYYDRTPEGAPPTQITQCQQWGFQRLVPCIDDMTAKCTYTTTIIADERYTSLLSNGDVTIPRHPVAPGKVSITYDNSVTPMAPYLFFLCAGSYAAFSREFEYPDGHRFRLELLVPPGSDPEVAEYALRVLADAILWVYLYTGPGGYERGAVKKEIETLVRERDLAKERGTDDLPGIRTRLRALAAEIAPGYRYTGTVYREIGMQNSDFGGMENVGNTTITMNRIMPFPQMTDPAFEYMIRVKVHEFYHNLNGSEVTGRSPFELWLNEAVTAFIENKFHAHLFGEDYSRLQTLLGLYAPSTGTFALDAGSASLPIEPEGFNDPNDLITGITYVKAAEFVRMIETLMGKEQFARGLDLYHTRYRHGNATWQQWIAAMEEVSGQAFSAMADTWLKQTGFPEISVSGRYDREHSRYTITAHQEVPLKGTPWVLPLRAALVDNEGRDLAERLVRMDRPDTVITFENVAEPGFLSINRECSFYGKVKDDADRGALRLQALHDRDVVNRFIALYRLAEREMIGLIDHPGGEPSEDFTGLYFGILDDDALNRRLGGLLLTLFDTVDAPQYAYRYGDLYTARRAMEHAIALRYKGQLLEGYHRHDRSISLLAPLDVQAGAIKERQVKNTCLALLATLDTAEIHEILRTQMNTGTAATDRLRAFSYYLNGTASDRLVVLETFGAGAAVHPVSWEAYLSIVGGCSSPDAVDLIRRAGTSPDFALSQVNDHRALYGTFAANRKISLQTPGGERCCWRSSSGSLLSTRPRLSPCCGRLIRLT